MTIYADQPPGPSDSRKRLGHLVENIRWTKRRTAFVFGCDFRTLTTIVGTWEDDEDPLANSSRPERRMDNEPDCAIESKAPVFLSVFRKARIEESITWVYSILISIPYEFPPFVGGDGRPRLDKALSLNRNRTDIWQKDEAYTTGYESTSIP